jgi:hypothetical protein
MSENPVKERRYGEVFIPRGIIEEFPSLMKKIMAELIIVKVKNQPPDLTAGEFNRGE